MFKYFKNLIKKDKGKNKEPSKTIKFINGASGFLKNMLLEIDVIAEKMQDLHKSNYDLANRHFKKGNISETVFRLKIVRKFWPEDKRAHFGLIYCYLIKENNSAAKKSMRRLYEIDQNIDEKIKQIKIRAQNYILKKNQELEKEESQREKISLSDIIYNNLALGKDDKKNNEEGNKGGGNDNKKDK